MSELVLHSVPDPAELAARAVACHASKDTRRMYAPRILAFIRSGRPLTRSGVLDHLGSFVEGVGARKHTISAIKTLAREADHAGMISKLELDGILAIKLPKQPGLRAGSWLSLEQCKLLLETAYRPTPKGDMNLAYRNSAIIATILGCGFRRAEISRLHWEQWNRLGSWTIDGRIVSAPDWAALRVNDWRTICVPDAARVFPVSEIRISEIVKSITARAGMPELSCEDLRRTAAGLALRHGASIDSVGQLLNHRNRITTKRYCDANFLASSTETS